MEFDYENDNRILNKSLMKGMKKKGFKVSHGFIPALVFSTRIQMKESTQKKISK